ncbi:gamma-glutamylcyclotransferase [Zobellella endophytica]|uniref:Gamma-glutamylcyclotransferase n=1 Tax=Zobellella endophytica TaxID=2116700 RepID=A0A2P7R2N7_9GAMM|nr:gamma-glutamylcyclotransferase family protein [Zobellella endophytica]PSJ44476.1 gamma-glutamylcyclotransferase [Zobellella endophytica]
MHYFAYGSNMSLARLCARVPGARPLGRFRLAGHRLCFHKVGRDGSGKCDAAETGNPADGVHGVVFALPPGGKARLDEVEGRGQGYGDKWVWVEDAGGRRWRAFTYYATRRDPGLRPYCWYLHHVLVGAREAALPADYIGALEAVACRPDPDPGRNAEEGAIYR